MRRALVLLLVAACGSPPRASSSTVDFSPTGLVGETTPIAIHYRSPKFGPSEIGKSLPVAEHIEITPALAGSFEVEAPDRARFVPIEPFADNVRYRIKAIGVEGAKAGTFHRRLLQVVGVHQRLPGVIDIELSHPVTALAIDAAVVLRGSSDEVIASKATLLDQGRLARFAAPGADQIEILPTLRSTVGNEALGKRVVRPVRPFSTDLIVEPFTVQQVGASYRLFARSTSPVTAADVLEALAVSPEIPITVEVGAASITLIGAWAPGTTYDLTLTGLKSPVGPAFFEPYRQRLVIPPLGAALGFADPYALLEGSARRKIGLEVAGTSKVALSVKRILADELGRLTPTFPDGDLEALGTIVHHRIAEVGQGHVELELGDADSAAPGLLVVQVVDTERPWIRARRFIVATELGLVVRVGPEILRAEVHSLGNGDPIAGAEVRFLTSDGRILGPIRTGPAGVAELYLDRPATIDWTWALRADDFAFLPHARSEVELGLDRRPLRPVWVEPDRSVARPSERLKVLLIGRESGFKADVHASGGLELVDGAGQVIAKAAAPIPEGHGAFELTIPRDARSGSASLRFVENGRALGESSILIDATDLAAPIRLEVAATPEGVFVVRGVSPYGGRVAGAMIASECTIDRLDGRAPETIVLPEAPLDPEGRLERACPLEGPGLEARRRLTASLAGQGPTTAAFAEDRRALAGGAIRFRLARSVIAIGEDPGLELSVDHLDGHDVALTITRRNDPKVEARTIAASVEPQKIDFKAELPGRYTFRASSGASERSIELHVVGADDVGGLAEDELLLLADGSTFPAGISARALAGLAGRLDLSVQRERVLQASSLRADSPITALSIPAVASGAPSVSLVARLHAPATSPGSRPRVAWGAAQVEVPRAKLYLPLELSIPSATTPSILPADLRVIGAKGRVPVYVVVKDAASPSGDPVEALAAGLSPTIPIFDLAKIGAEPRPIPTWAPLLSSSVAARVGPEQIIGPLYTALDGRLRVPIDLSAARGPVRVAAIAIGFDQLGYREVEVPIAPRLLLTIEGPAFLRPGDRASLPVRLDGPSEGVRAISVQIKGAGRLEGLAEQAIGPNHRAYFDVIAERAGAIELEASVRNEPAALARSSLPVRSPGPRVVAGLAMAVKNGEPARFMMPPEVASDPEAIARMSLGPHRGPAFIAAFDAVAETEVRTSRLISRGLSRLALRELGDSGAIDVAIEAITARLGAGAVLAEWPSGGPEPEGLPIDAAHFLLEARRQGITVSPRILDALLDRLVALVRASGDVGLRTEAAYVVAQAGRGAAIGDALASLIATPELSGSSRALLAAAGTLAKIDGPADGYAAVAGEPVRRRARALLAVATILPNHSELTALIDAMSVPSGRWYDPGGEGLGLLALSIATRNAPTKEYWASIFLAGVPLKRSNSTRFLVIASEPGVWNEQELSAFVTGAGSLWLGLSVVGHGPTPLPGASGIELTRTCAVDGQPLGPTVTVGARLACLHQLTGVSGPVRLRVPIPGGFSRGKSEVKGTVLYEQILDGQVTIEALPNAGSASYLAEWIPVVAGRLELPAVDGLELFEPSKKATIGRAEVEVTR